MVQKPLRYPNSDCAEMAIRLHKFESTKVSGPGSSRRKITEILWTKEDAMDAMLVSDEEYDEYDTIEQIDSALGFSDSRNIHGQIIPCWETRLPCIIRKAYYYRNRRFCIRNYGIEKFQKLWREFHYIKMTRYKAVKNLRYRQLYGKYPKNKL